MSFQPQNASPFASAQRPLDDSYWRASRNPGGNKLPGYGLSGQPSTVTDTLNGFLGNQRTLPMYKDKPYFAPRRTGPRFRRKRTLYGSVVLLLLGLLWWYRESFGYWSGFSLGGPDLAKGEELWHWMQSLDSESENEGQEPIDWAARRERVRDAFIVSWDGYEKYAWGLDEYYPVRKGGRHMVQGGMGWIIVDALDTLMIMNLTSRVQHARNWIHNSLHYNQDHDVNTFETTIRMLGGLLSAHYLSTKYPNLAPVSDDDAGAPGEDLYIETATDLANRLLGAFDSNSGIPYASVNLNKSMGLPSHADAGASSTAEATTVQLEFKYLAKLTGEAEYWRAVERVMEVVDAQQVEDGLVPIYIDANSGHFRGSNIRLGSRGDSYYEYLIKQYLQTSKQEPIYKDMWDEALMGVRKHLIAYTKNAQLTILGERPDGLHNALHPKMDHLVCFMPGTIALGATGGQLLSEAKKSREWTQRHAEEILLAKELMKTCWATYLYTQTGLAPEITYFEVDSPPVMMGDLAGSTMTEGNRQPDQEEDLPLISKPLEPVKKDGSDHTASWRDDINIHTQDRHNLQRPETVESLMYMYRITGDETYRQWGWEMFKSFVKHTAVVETDGHQHPSGSDEGQADGSTTTTHRASRIVGFTSLSNADSIPPSKRDNMESFWLAETLKYFYLLFSDREFLSLEENVFNTEAHPFPKFELKGDLKTGWTRKTRS
ncbi:hypothetical protein ASPZODRAFT_141057 [Penicilliopsis zonata CBS 506.65]|uniref:alpha-1,2-Mannosidase n=1 Tax=Penicilliopsis zonata CBS 506.65 TaxID=1073090 RepID=A0A1L9SJX6_9EURO|nr:hypothetical protein ASPZODRAFT_141057 [Penicilliopsis zonata CBS 506.65]OJJ47465.1 hypothetical protein ASPZODRAFT_141057 [Penicilliopsis zonata CBS 506.65]